MNKLFTFLISIAISTSLIAQTTVSGSQSGIWTASNSPYNVVEEVTVPSGETLTIEAGVEVSFQGHYKLTVLGQLDAIGTETDSIFFTTDNPTIGWHGIRLGQSIDGYVTPADGISNFSYCRIEYGKTKDADYPDNHGGALVMISSDAVFNNCIFADNTSLPGNGMGGAIYAINTGSEDEPVTLFTNCKFIRNVGYTEGGAIKFTSDYNTEITNCEFIDNSTSYGGGAIMFYSVVDTKVVNCLFAGNYTNYTNGGAIETLGVALNTVFFKNCTMTGNSAYGGDGGAAALYYAEVDFVNCIIYDNEAAYGGTQSDNVWVDAGSSSATINYCNLIMPEYNTTGSNNINTDPLFVNATNGDYHLQETSSCIDTGLDIGLPYEGTAPDMGCFEYGMPNSIKDYLSDNLLIYPNPSTGLFMIENAERVESFTISDISGKVILKKQISGKSHIEINISDFTKGIYFINILSDNNSISTHKMILLN